MNWLVCYVKVGVSRITDRSDIFGWVRRYVIRRRMQPPEFHLAKKPREALDFPAWFTHVP